MTDSRSKTKANSINALNRHRRGSSSINTITINDDTDSISDIDSQTVLNAIRDRAAKSPSKSPWKDEMDFNSNKEDSNIFRTPVRPIFTRKSVTTGRIARKNAINKDLIERSIQRSNQGQQIKFSTVGKTQKYHWSGTFHRSRRNLYFKDKYRDTLYSPRDNEPNELNDQLTNYNYYNEDFEKKKSTNKRDIFCSNEFDSQTNSDSWKDEWIDDSIDYQPYIDICTNEFTKFDRFKDYDIEQNNDALPTAFPDININLRRMTDVDNKDKKMCNIDLRTKERDNATIFYSQLAHNSNINKKECDNPCNAKESIDSSINIELNTRKMINDIKKKSVVRSCCYKAWCFLVSFLKNIILFLLLPVVYIIIFIYIQKREGSEKQNNI